jgi:hypothetical protein
LSVRRSDSVQPATLQLQLAGQPLSDVRVDGAWTELRWPVPASALPSGHQQVTLHSPDPKARFEVDHLLLIPTPTGS